MARVCWLRTLLSAELLEAAWTLLLCDVGPSGGVAVLMASGHVKQALVAS